MPSYHHQSSPIGDTRNTHAPAFIAIRSHHSSPLATIRSLQFSIPEQIVFLLSSVEQILQNHLHSHKLWRSLPTQHLPICRFRKVWDAGLPFCEQCILATCPAQQSNRSLMDANKFMLYFSIQRCPDLHSCRFVGITFSLVGTSAPLRMCP